MKRSILAVQQFDLLSTPKNRFEPKRKLTTLSVQIFANFANFAQIREIKSSRNAFFLSSLK